MGWRQAGFAGAACAAMLAVIESWTLNAESWTLMTRATGKRSKAQHPPQNDQRSTRNEGPTVRPERVYALPPLPMRPAAGHKGLFGRVLVVGGNQEMIGAPILAGTAALRAGSGLVQVAMHADTLAAGLSITPELIGLGLRRDDQPLLAAAAKADVLVVGPGLGRSTEATRRVCALIGVGKPLVLDADALNILADERRRLTFPTETVLTPHPGEMKRLARHLDDAEIPPEDDRSRVRFAATAARAFGGVLVLKGHQTIVTDGTRAYVNRTGDSSLSKAGSGDVLAGLIGSLMGQGMCGFDAACAAVWIHGRAGELAGQRMGRRSVLARDVIGSLPDAIRHYERA